MPSCPAAEILSMARDLADHIREEARYLPNTLEFLNEEAEELADKMDRLGWSFPKATDDDECFPVHVEKDERPASAGGHGEATYPWLKEQAI